MKHHLIILPLLLSLTHSVFAYHGEGKDHHKKPEFFQNMTPEERAEFEVLRDKMNSMSKKERKAFRKEAKEKWEALSNSDKQAFIKDNQEKIDKALERQQKRIIMRLYGAELLKKEIQ